MLDVVARPAVGPGRGDARRGPVPRRLDGSAYVRGLRVRRGGGDPQALPGLLRLARRPQPRPGRRWDRASWPTCMLPPFEMALRAGARSVMNSYTDIDGDPVGRRRRTCSRRCCATRSASTGTVAADYFSVAFLHTLHRDRRRPRRGRAAGPRGRHRRRAADRRRLRRAAARGTHRRTRRREAGRPGRRRVLRQKCELGLLDPGWAPVAAEPSRPRPARGTRPGSRAGPPLGGAAGQRRRRPPPARGRHGRARRSQRRHQRGDAGLLLVPDARARPPPRHPARRRDPDAARGARRRAVRSCTSAGAASV